MTDAAGVIVGYVDTAVGTYMTISENGQPACAVVADLVLAASPFYTVAIDGFTGAPSIRRCSMRWTIICTFPSSSAVIIPAAIVRVVPAWCAWFPASVRCRDRYALSSRSWQPPDIRHSSGGLKSSVNLRSMSPAVLMAVMVFAMVARLEPTPGSILPPATIAKDRQSKPSMASIVITASSSCRRARARLERFAPPGYFPDGAAQSTPARARSTHRDRPGAYLCTRCHLSECLCMQ